MAVIKNQLTLRLEPIVHAKIKKLADSDNRSITNMIDTILKREIQRYEDENGEIEVTDEDIYAE